MSKIERNHSRLKYSIKDSTVLSACVVIGLAIIASLMVLLAIVVILYNIRVNQGEELIRKLESQAISIIDMQMTSRGNFVLVQDNNGNITKYEIDQNNYAKAYKIWDDAKE